MKKYDTYKHSGIEWIGEIPMHWDVKRFGYIFTFSRGLGITKQDLHDEGIPCVNYGEIHSKYGVIINPEIHKLKCVEEQYLQTDAKSLLRRGDFVFADTSEDIKGSGNFTCLDSDMLTFAGYHTVVASHSNVNSYKYLAYYFDSLGYRSQIRSCVSGIKVFSITQAILKYSIVILPSISEQTAIANYLDRKTAEIDSLIADKKRLLELYEEEKTAIINQAVTKGINPDAPMKGSGIDWLGEIPQHWEVKRLKYVGKVQTGKTPKIQYSDVDFFENGEIQWFTPSDFDNNNELIESNRKLIQKAIENDEAVLFPEYSIYLVSIGATLGKVSFFRDRASANQQINVVSFFDKVYNPLFGYYFLIGNKEMITLNADYTTLPILNQSKTKDLIMSTPPIDEQDRIVDFIEKECIRIDKKKSKTEKLIQLLTEYRTALISEVVTGKIKVID